MPQAAQARETLPCARLSRWACLAAALLLRPTSTPSTANAHRCFRHHCTRLSHCRPAQGSPLAPLCQTAPDRASQGSSPGATSAAVPLSALPYTSTKPLGSGLLDTPNCIIILIIMSLCAQEDMHKPNKRLLVLHQHRTSAALQGQQGLAWGHAWGPGDGDEDTQGEQGWGQGQGQGAAGRQHTATFRCALQAPKHVHVCAYPTARLA